MMAEAPLEPAHVVPRLIVPSLLLGLPLALLLFLFFLHLRVGVWRRGGRSTAATPAGGGAGHCSGFYFI